VLVTRAVARTMVYMSRDLLIEKDRTAAPLAAAVRLEQLSRGHRTRELP
jgi:hypothetical protein